MRGRHEVDLEGGTPTERVDAEAGGEAVGDARGLDRLGERLTHVPLAASRSLATAGKLGRLGDDRARTTGLEADEVLAACGLRVIERLRGEQRPVERRLDAQDAELCGVAELVLVYAQIEEARGARGGPP